MKVFVQAGKILPYTNAGSAIVSGQFFLMGKLVVCATGDIAASTGTGEVIVEGVLTAPSDTGTAWAQGDRLFWDDSGKTFTKTALANTPAGFAAAAKLSAATTASVKLQPAVSGQAAVVAANATTVATDLTTAEALANSLQTSLNAILTSLKAAGLMANS